jgi:hypothetical protein
VTLSHRQKPEELLAELLADFSRRSRFVRPVRIVHKRDYWHQRAIALALRVVTFGQMRTYVSHYVTTLGHTVYVPDGFEQWDPAIAYETLRHEAVHVAQFERLGFFLMAFVYLVVPLPFGLAYGRARLEWEAYRETLRSVAELEGLSAARDPRRLDEIVRRFTGPDYGWMWPFPGTIRRWIAEALREIERDSKER